MFYYIDKQHPKAGILYCHFGELLEETLRKPSGDLKTGPRPELVRVQKIPEDIEKLCYLFQRPLDSSRSAFALSSDPELAFLQMMQKDEGVHWLNRRLMVAESEDEAEEERRSCRDLLAEPAVRSLIEKGRGTAVNILHPRWWENAGGPRPENGRERKKRVNILAIGDVGSTLMTGLKLLGGDVIGSIGICDIDEKVTTYWEYEMNQISLPWEYDRMPEVEVIGTEDLFDCDVFVFCASKGIPPVGSQVADVRMVQFEQNAAIVAGYAKMARMKGFRGLFAVVSDPVDPLCKTAFLESNRDENGTLDYRGLRAEQIQGYGLGVMNARAAYFAKRDSRFASFLSEGRAFGPHGDDLVIANSIERYDDALSKELTQLAVTANLKVREAGYKPYVAPALSSGALSILLTIKGRWHYSSTFMGGVFMGAKNRFTEMGIETECIGLPVPLFSRIQQAADHLAEIV